MSMSENIETDTEQLLSLYRATGDLIQSHEVSSETVLKMMCLLIAQTGYIQTNKAEHIDLDALNDFRQVEIDCVEYIAQFIPCANTIHKTLHQYTVVEEENAVEDTKH